MAVQSQVSSVWYCPQMTLCGAKYRTLSQVVSHVRSTHSEESIVCNIEATCQKSFRTAGAWYWHIRHHHSNVYGVAKRSRFDSTVEVIHNDDAVHSDGDIENAGGHSDDGDIIDNLMPDCNDGELLDEADRHGHAEHNNMDESDGEIEVRNDVNHCAIYDSIDQRKDVRDVAMDWLIKLRLVHRISNTALSDVIELAGDVHMYYCDQIKKTLQAVSKQLCNTCSFSCLPLLDDCLSDCMSMDDLRKLSSRYQQQIFMREKYSYVDPVWHELPSAASSSAINPPRNGFYYVPILDSLQCLLRHSQVAEQVESGSHSYGTGLLHDLSDGTFVHESTFFRSSPTALQIILYYDEFTAVNPMAPTSRQYKLGAVYFTLANLDPGQRSKLEAIHLVSLFHYSLLNAHSFDEVLRPLVRDVKDLQENGHMFEICGTKKNIKGTILCVVGDTPALALVGGFKAGVGFADKKCRHCMANNDQIQTKFTEEEFTLRSMQSHVKHCDNMEKAGIRDSERKTLSKQYGVTRRSLLCSIPGFDVTKQLPLDIMHVLFEGLFHLQIKLFLGHIIDNLQLLTLSEFNHNLKTFNFAYFEDRPHPITSAALSKGILGQTAHEIWQLYHIIPFLIGDCVPKSDPHLACYLLLQEISSILCTDIITEDLPPYLRVLIQEYLSSLKTLYPTVNLPPKAHYLVHCPSYLKRFGPMCRTWSMRFEGKHREFKQLCRKTSFKNLLKTLVNHHQCRIAYLMQQSVAFAELQCKVGGASTCCRTDELDYSSELQDLFTSSHVQPQSLPSTVTRHSYATVLGTCYRVLKCYLFLASEECDGEVVPVFGRLEDVMQVQDDIIFVCRRMKTVAFDSYYGAFCVQDLQAECFSCFFAQSLKCHYLFNVTSIGSKMYIKSKFDLSGYLQYEL